MSNNIVTRIAKQVRSAYKANQSAEEFTHTRTMRPLSNFGCRMLRHHQPEAGLCGPIEG
jgi:hypothetical protein